MTDLRSPEEVAEDILDGLGWSSRIPQTAAIIRADREQVERDTIRRVVEWLRKPVLGGDSLEPVCDTYAQAADAIEAGEWKGTDHG